MSELYAVHVTAVTPTSATLEVDEVHPDAGPPQATATFALMLLYDPIINSGYSAFSRYTHLESSASIYIQRASSAGARASIHSTTCAPWAAHF